MGGKRLTDDDKLTIYNLHRDGRSNREIAAYLGDTSEDGNGPDQSTVARYVRQLPQMPDDDPFQWHLLNKTGIPVDASEWVLRCAHEYGARKLVVLRDAPQEAEITMKIVDSWPPFTNRWARWCWQVHQGAPDLEVPTVMALALEYATANQLQDLLNVPPGPIVAGLDAFLTFRPDRSPANASQWLWAVKLGHIARFPELDDVFDRVDQLQEAPTPVKQDPRLHIAFANELRIWVISKIGGDLRKNDPTSRIRVDSVHDIASVEALTEGWAALDFQLAVIDRERSIAEGRSSAEGEGGWDESAVKTSFDNEENEIKQKARELYETPEGKEAYERFLKETVIAPRLQIS